ncbi:unnamed protein product [Prorocentrum cordatum]|uniref:3'-5' exonuclease domain-containing protein n=1 Tax=Prorocentrum cordatum TaxID=2364126 RepID=A0ABN9V2J4_9DINO|nr:unnamed protein product [Polarella glacialis]
MLRFMQTVTEGGTGGVADGAEAEGGPAAEERGRGGAGTGTEYDCFHGKIVVIDIATDVEIKKGVQSFPYQAWFEELLQSCGTVGFDMEWKPDRYAGSDNRVALMQFSDAETAVLVRTHRTDAWLPDVLVELLTGKRVTKICVGYDGSDKRKLLSTFNFELDGVVDLAELAPSKGKKNTGLKKLAADFGWQMRKESRVARSDWSATKLTEDQIQYAAEDAYFTFMIFEELADLPDAPVESDDDADAAPSAPEQSSVLTLKPGWAEQGIVKNNNGLWCSVCNKGPMLHVDVMEKHVLSKLHMRKTQPEKAAAERAAAAPAEAAVAAEVPPELSEQGIVRGGEGGHRGTQAEYLCAACDAGPFQCLKAAEAHVNGRKHESLQRKRETEAAIQTGKLPPELEVAGGEVTDSGTFRCRFCETAGPFQDLLSLRQHLNGKWHIKFAGLPEKPEEEDEFAALAGDEPVDLMEGLPAYVEERSEGAFFCGLCGCKATGLGTMQRHLVGEGHSRSCQRTGHPELVYIKERDQLEEVLTGKAVKRSETYQRQKAPGACAGGGGHPEGWVAIPVGRGLALGKEGLAPIDEDGPERSPSPSASPGGAPLPSPSASSSRAPFRRGGDAPAAAAAAAACGGEEPAEVVAPGSFVRAATTVVPPAPGWVWDLSTCLAVTAGDALQAEAEARTAAPGWPRGQAREDLRADVQDFIWRSALDARAAEAVLCEDPTVQRALLEWDQRDPVSTGENPSAILMSRLRQAREAPRGALRCADLEAGERCADFEMGRPRRRRALEPGQVLLARHAADEPHPEWAWALDDCLLPPAGHQVEVLAVEGGWVYGECGGRHGWLHPDALCGGEDGPASELEVAAQLGPPTLRRDGEGPARLSQAEFAELVRSTA